jgi:chromosome segregation ATPase
MLNFRFRSRSSQRDQETDQARLAGVVQAVRSAVANAESELNGLRARLEKARQSAGMLLGNDMDNGDGGGAHESELRRVEEQLLGAERRIAELKDHLAALQRIESAVNVELSS